MHFSGIFLQTMHFSVQLEFLPVESPHGVSTGRKSNLQDLGIA